MFVAVALFWAPGLGDGGKRADPGAELGPASAGKVAPKEPRCERVGSDDCGVHSSWEVVDVRLVVIIGWNRSRDRSKISEPMAPIADEYLSRRIRDSFTMKSANKRTRSASVPAVASLAAKL